MWPHGGLEAGDLGKVSGVFLEEGEVGGVWLDGDNLGIGEMEREKQGS